MKRRIALIPARLVRIASHLLNVLSRLSTHQSSDEVLTCDDEMPRSFPLSHFNRSLYLPRRFISPEPPNCVAAQVRNQELASSNIATDLMWMRRLLSVSHWANAWVFEDHGLMGRGE